MNITDYPNDAFEIIEDGITTYIRYGNGDQVWWDVIDGERVVVRVHTYNDIVWDRVSE